MNIDESPLRVLLWFAQHYAIEAFNVDIFEYVPKRIGEVKTILRIPANELVSWFEQHSRALGENKEIALHSRVHRGCYSLHIPMLDFSTTSFSTAEKIALTLCREYDWYGYALFETGRSFHLYGLGLFSPDEFPEFLGRALLFNDANESPVDARWIGHRLMDGFGALRATCNSPRYLQEPKLAVFALDVE